MAVPAVTPSTISDVRTIALSVADQDAALEFYVGTLGFTVRIDGQASPTTRWVEVAAADAPVTIALIAAEPVASPVDAGIRFAASDAERERAELHDRGVTVGDLLHWEGVPPMFTFDDPDGNRFFVVEARP